MIDAATELSQKREERKRAYTAAYYEAHKEKIDAYQAAYRVEYYLANKAKLLAKQAAYRAANKKKIAASSAAYRAKNKDKIAKFNAENKERIAAQKAASPKRKKSRAAYYAKHRERLLADNAIYRVQHPEASRRASRKRRALKRNAIIGDTKLITQWEMAWKSKRRVKCYWCSKRLSPKQCHTDHIHALSKGGPHTVENLCISCADCNVSKRMKSIKEWNEHIAEPVLL